MADSDQPQGQEGYGQDGGEVVDQAAGWVVGAIAVLAIAPIALASAVLAWLWERRRLPLAVLFVLAAAGVWWVGAAEHYRAYGHVLRILWVATRDGQWAAVGPGDWLRMAGWVAPTAVAGGAALALPVVALRRWRTHDQPAPAGQPTTAGGARGGPGLVGRLRGWLVARRAAHQPDTRAGLLVALSRRLPVLEED